MSINKYTTAEGLVTLANGSRMWVGTKAAYEAAKQAGTMPNDILAAITDDEIQYERRERKAWTDAAAFKEAISAAAADQNLPAHKLALGDYYVDTNYTYVVADIDTFYGGSGFSSSFAVLGTHHLGIIVMANTATTTWGSTTNGYAGSNLHTYLTDTVLPAAETFFGSSNILRHNICWTTSDNAWAWTTTPVGISALTESQIYGSPILSQDIRQQGEGCKKLAVFDKYFFSQIFGNTQDYILRSITSSSQVCQASSQTGVATATSTLNQRNVAGLILVK